MLKERFAFLRKLEILADIGLAAVVFYWLNPLPGFNPVLPVFLIIWAGLLYALGVYESFRTKHFSDILFTVWCAALIGVGIFGSVAYLFKFRELSRLSVMFMFFAAAGLISLEKTAAMAFFRQIRKKGFNFRNILVIGTGSRARRFMDLVSQHSEWGLKIIGLIDENESLAGKQVNGFPVLGALKDVAEIAHNNVIDEVVCIVPRSWFPKIEEIVFFCETEGIKVDVAIDVFDLKFAKAKQTELEGFLMLSFERAPMKVWHLFFKGLFDIAFSGTLLVLLLPIYIATAIAIKITSPGPVFFRQTRCGRNGRKFTLYKFRTMVENAESLLPKLKNRNEMKGPVFKISDDPRVTPLGKVLRKFSIDELPQLWNVFIRDMSIVGPRPPIPEEVKEYDSWQRRRLTMRPGITCLWQVQGRNKIKDFNEWARLDLEYIDHWSFWDDFRILVKTVPAVVLGVGAK